MYLFVKDTMMENTKCKMHTIKNIKYSRVNPSGRSGGLTRSVRPRVNTGAYR